MGAKGTTLQTWGTPWRHIRVLLGAYTLSLPPSVMPPPCHIRWLSCGHHKEWVWRQGPRSSTLLGPRRSLLCHLTPPPLRPHILKRLNHAKMTLSKRSQEFVHPPSLRDLKNHLQRNFVNLCGCYCPRLTSISKEQYLIVCAS